MYKKILLAFILVAVLSPLSALAASPADSCCSCLKDPAVPEGEIQLLSPDATGKCPAADCTLQSKPCSDEQLKKDTEEYNKKAKDKAETKPLIMPSLQTLKNIVSLDSQVKIEGADKGNRYYTIPWIAQLVGGLYRFGVGTAAVLAVVMIVIGGFIWMTSGGDSNRISSAKSYITGSIIGLVLALGSYSILYLVNPELVYLRPIKVPYIETENLDLMDIAQGSDYQLTGETANVAPDGSVSNLVKIAAVPGLVVSCDDPQCTEQCYNGLKAAAAKMQAQGYTIRVTSCYRSPARQLTMKGNPMACQCKDSACSSCPHVRGVAIDAFCSQEKVGFAEMKASGKKCKGSGECREAAATRTDYNCQNVLISAMRASGMGKLYFEDWHFQPTGTCGACR